ncbi:MAG: ATP-grasp domain-containing protein [Candidatus Riflebacteria bacterium]|nr:ATP-grasp domain-containing protein [Candidatus Riflebacteria bacterium]
MKTLLTILNFSIYDNRYDPQSNVLLEQACEKAGVPCAIVNFDREVRPTVDSPLVWLRYDIRSKRDLMWILEVAAALRNAGKKVFPSPRAIWLAEDKWETHLVLARAGVPIPRTLQAKDLHLCGFPVIIKARVGWGGMENKILFSEADLAVLPPYNPKEFICQTYIDHPGTLIMAIAGNQEICCIEDEGESAFAESRVAILPAPKGALELSRQALRATGLVTGTVDMLESPDGLKVLEVNSAPRLTYPHLPQADLAGPMCKAVLESFAL